MVNWLFASLILVWRLPFRPLDVLRESNDILQLWWPFCCAVTLVLEKSVIDWSVIDHVLSSLRSVIFEQIFPPLSPFSILLMLGITHHHVLVSVIFGPSLGSLSSAKFISSK